MAFGLVGASGSFQVNAEMLGGLVTGSGNEFLALPISGTVLGGLSGLTTNEWSRFYLSDSFGAASGSVIQALNYLSASIKTNADGDVAGPGSATDNAIVRFDGATGKIIQNTTGLVASDAGIISSSVGATLGNLILNDDARSLTLSGTISSSAGATFLGHLFANNINVSGTLTAASFTPAAVSGAVKINVFTHKILSNNAIETSASLVAKTTISGAGLVSANALTTEEATINVAGAYSGSGGIAGQSLTVANLYKVTSAGAVSSSVGATLGNLILNNDGTSLQLSGASTFVGVATHTGHPIFNSGITIKNADASAGYINFFEQSSNGTNVCTFRGKSSMGNCTITLPGDTGTVVLEDNTVTLSNKTLTSPKVDGTGISSSVGSTLGNLILNNEATSLVLSGSMTGSGLANFSNVSLAQGGGYKPALIVSSSAISTAANAAAIPRVVLQGTDHLGNLADFMISVSGGILRAEKLTDGTWPV